MPHYQVIGTGRESGRTRKRVYYARNESQARSHAEHEGTLVREIIELPPQPPTDWQRDKAMELGIVIPEGVTDFKMVAT